MNFDLNWHWPSPEEFSCVYFVWTMWCDRCTHNGNCARHAAILSMSQPAVVVDDVVRRVRPQLYVEINFLSLYSVHFCLSIFVDAGLCHSRVYANAAIQSTKSRNKRVTENTFNCCTIRYKRVLHTKVWISGVNYLFTVCCTPDCRAHDVRLYARSDF